MEFPKSEEETLSNSLLQQCRKEGICFCKDGELPKDHKKRCRALERLIQQSEDARNRYSGWSLVDLKTVLKQRQIPLPKPKRRSKPAITKLLQQSDSQIPSVSWICLPKSVCASTNTCSSTAASKTSVPVVALRRVAPVSFAHLAKSAMRPCQSSMVQTVSALLCLTWN